MLTTVQSTIRHILGMLLGSFLADGIVSGDQIETLTSAISAIVGVVVLVAWSVIEKKLAKK